MLDASSHFVDKIMSRFLFLLWFLLCWFSSSSLTVQAQPTGDWHLEKDKDQIQVYSRHVAGSRLTELKVECTLPGTQSQLVALLSDIANYKKTIYKTKSAYLVRRTSETQLTYHIINELPWPVEDRDLTIQMTFAQDPASKLLHIRAVGVPNVVPVQTGIVRVADWLAVWQVRSVGRRNLQVTYTCRVDPGGSIPAWLDNLAAATSAYRSFVLIRESLPQYQGKTFSFLRD
ncbi:START domain-containing protein [Spirosoma sp. RP8]|uniref:START domain-containing protein n=2 Tax=Spirosoma liriopis TaxID=2937440 RepID=A0ABT0HS37_9BACT|nr:START domain-containing protein [Spirosoma liriopis]